MHLGEVIGTVVCTQKVDSWEGQRLRLVQPISQDGEGIGHPLVALEFERKMTSADSKPCY